MQPTWRSACGYRIPNAHGHEPEAALLPKPWTLILCPRSLSSAQPAADRVPDAHGHEPVAARRPGKAQDLAQAPAGHHHPRLLSGHRHGMVRAPTLPGLCV